MKKIDFSKHVLARNAHVQKYKDAAQTNLRVTNYGICISVIDSTDEGSDKSKGLSDDSNDLNKSVSGIFFSLPL